MILFEGSCIIVPLHLGKDSNHLNFKTPANSVRLLFNISIDANSVDPEEQSDLDLHCLLKRLQNG